MGYSFNFESAISFVYMAAACLLTNVHLEKYSYRRFNKMCVLQFIILIPLVLLELAIICYKFYVLSLFRKNPDNYYDY